MSMKKISHAHGASDAHTASRPAEHEPLFDGDERGALGSDGDQPDHLHSDARVAATDRRRMFGPTRAFVPAAAPRWPSASRAQRVCRASSPRWLCAASPEQPVNPLELSHHPYGNGGLNNVCDSTGYSREAALAQAAEDDAEYEAYKASIPAEARSMWTVIYNTDLIQWDGNLLDLALEKGLDLRADGARVVSLSEEIARTLTEGSLDSLWVLDASEAARTAGGDVELSARDLIVAHQDAAGKLLFAWEQQDDAVRFAQNLEQDGRTAAAPTPVLLPLADIKAACAERSMRIGFMTPSFINPSHFAPPTPSPPPPLP